MSQYLDERRVIFTDDPAFTIAPTRDEEGRLVSTHAHVQEYVDRSSLFWISVGNAFIGLAIAAVAVIVIVLLAMGIHHIPDHIGN